MTINLKNEIASIINNRRFEAEAEAAMNNNYALKNEQFLQLENQIGGLIIDCARFKKGSAEEKEIENQIEEKRKQQDKVLESMNMTRKMLSPIYTCKHCNDTGTNKKGMCVCAKQLMNKLLIEKCGMKLQYITLDQCVDIDKDIICVLKQLCEMYPKSTKISNVLLMGEAGAGKTIVTHAMANAFIKKYLYTFFASATKLVNDCLAYHTTFNETKTQFIEPYFECDVLIIDDLGTEPMLRNVTKEYILNIISERTLRDKLTIITTNLTPEGIKQSYDERIFSRVFDAEYALSFYMQAPVDLRLQKRNFKK